MTDLFDNLDAPPDESAAPETPAAPEAPETPAAPEVEAPAAPETPVAPAADTPAAPEHRPAVVPQAALAEAREQLRQAKQQIAELQAQPKLTQEDRELLADLKAQRAAAQATVAKGPDFIEDPKGYVDAAIKKLEEGVTAAKSTATETREEVSQNKQLQELVTTIQAQETQFTAETPDYHDALNHMRQQRAAQLQMLVPNATEQQVWKQIQIEELRAANAAVQAGKNPAETAYKLAGTFGYRKASAPAAPVVAPAAAPDRDAARTLSAATGADTPRSEAADDGEVSTPEFAAAMSERFGRRR